jgi:RES domain-containing protein
VILWRISNHASLDGAGGLLASGRWHTRGRRIVYCAPNPATALLEMLVHAEIDRQDLPVHYRLIKVDVPEDVERRAIDMEGLADERRLQPSSTRAIGDVWLRSAATALLDVPCAIVPDTWNTVINPTHPDARRLTIADVQSFRLDERLI